VDVPPPDAEAEPVADWQQPYTYVVDEKRELAERFEFFYYPTLFILDREGTARFAGNCEIEKVKQMVAEIQAEKPDSPKKIYTPPLPALGTAAAPFTGKTLDDKEAKLDILRGKKGTLLFFGSSTCPFSVQALEHVKKIAEEFGKQDVSVVVVNKSEPAEGVRKVYAQHSPSAPVVLDSDGAIFKSYAMEPVPFFFVLNAAGKITHRRPFTAEAATADLKAMLEGKSASAAKGCGAG
jgi:peroxiredoxin